MCLKFLGIQFQQSKKGFCLYQTDYVKEIFSEFGLKNYNPYRTPLPTSLKLVMDIWSTYGRKIGLCHKHTVWHYLCNQPCIQVYDSFTTNTHEGGQVWSKVFILLNVTKIYSLPSLKSTLLSLYTNCLPLSSMFNINALCWLLMWSTIQLEKSYRKMKQSAKEMYLDTKYNKLGFMGRY